MSLLPARRRRNVVLAVAVLLAVIAAACAGEDSGDGEPDEDQAADQPQEDPDAEEPAEPAEPEEQDGDAGDGSDEATAELFDEIVEEVAELRDLPVEAEVPMEVVSAEEITDIALADAEDELEEIARSEAIAKALHQIPEDTDLLELNEQLIEAGVAGIYVPEDERAYVVGDDDEELSPLEQVTVAHEVVHGLQDRFIDLTVLDGFEDDPDGAMAFSSLIEGDASQLQERWASTHLSEEEQQQRYAEEQQMGAEQLETLGDLPPALLESFVAPYTAGPAFIEGITADQEDTDAIDAALEDPPETMLEVFDPAAYQEGFEPEPVEVGAIPEGYERTADWTWGAFEVALMLELTDEQAVDPQLIQAWRGGRLAGFQPGEGEQAVVAVGWAFADEDAAGQMCEVVADWHATVADGEATDDPDVLRGPD
ncbi:MAG: hypothetical protein ACLFRD_11920, partial [Nitriliruptoraceae bacterium]